MATLNTYHLTDAVYRALLRTSAEETHKEIVLLESQLDGHPESSATYLAAFPQKKLISKDGVSSWNEGSASRTLHANPWSLLKKMRNESGWLFGYIGYDMKNYVESLSSLNRAYYNAPDLFMMEPSVLFRIENGEIEQLLGDPIPIEKKQNEISRFKISNAAPDISREEYIAAIREIKDLIREGDFYEMNFSYPFKAQFDGDPYGLYNRMRQINPVPFAGYLKLDNLSVCCSSPERFLKKSGEQLMSEPIKGTSGRHTDPRIDDQLKNELKNEKNEAENLMIVDLVRHDMSRVSKPGSIKVSKLYDIQTFGTVHQLISRVEGDMMAGTDPVDALKACFPMGSMTGAPKLRVIQEIDRLECYRRGIYSGSIGYFTPEGDFDFNVVIRSTVIQGDTLTYPVGGAITGDSDPDEEWDETMVKARVLTGAV